MTTETQTAFATYDRWGFEMTLRQDEVEPEMAAEGTSTVERDKDGRVIKVTWERK